MGGKMAPKITQSLKIAPSASPTTLTTSSGYNSKTAAAGRKVSEARDEQRAASQRNRAAQQDEQQAKRRVAETRREKQQADQRVSEAVSEEMQTNRAAGSPQNQVRGELINVVV